jgi:hypothetical protein
MVFINKNDDADLWGHGHRHGYDNYNGEDKTYPQYFLPRILSRDIIILVV